MIMSKFLLVLHITWFGKNKKNVSQISKLPLALHLKPLVKAIGHVDYLCPEIGHVDYLCPEIGHVDYLCPEDVLIFKNLTR